VTDGPDIIADDRGLDRTLRQSGLNGSSNERIKVVPTVLKVRVVGPQTDRNGLKSPNNRACDVG
jgi:hypothetical protein